VRRKYTLNELIEALNLHITSPSTSPPVFLTLRDRRTRNILCTRQEIEITNFGAYIALEFEQ
jgi:hypothetical protein